MNGHPSLQDACTYLGPPLAAQMQQSMLRTGASSYLCQFVSSESNIDVMNGIYWRLMDTVRSTKSTWCISQHFVTLCSCQTAVRFRENAGRPSYTCIKHEILSCGHTLMSSWAGKWCIAGSHIYTLDCMSSCLWQLYIPSRNEWSHPIQPAAELEDHVHLRVCSIEGVLSVCWKPVLMLFCRCGWTKQRMKTNSLLSEADVGTHT